VLSGPHWNCAAAHWQKPFGAARMEAESLPHCPHLLAQLLYRPFIANWLVRTKQDRL
jgi:hypothetical protein